MSAPGSDQLRLAIRELLAENDILGLPFDEEHGGTGTGHLIDHDAEN
mgnify:CR=1 FL=1